VALALTQNFDIPPENLVVQGYGEQFLKVRTEASNEQNRRASIRRSRRSWALSSPRCAEAPGKHLEGAAMAAPLLHLSVQSEFQVPKQAAANF
jgi:hypothetical protein